MDFKSSHEYQIVNTDEFSTKFVLIKPEGILLPEEYIDAAEDVYKFKFRTSDVVIAGYPKSGTTWLQEIVWTMIHNPNFNNQNKDDDIMMKSPLLELWGEMVEGYMKSVISKYKLESSVTFWNYIDNYMSDPRIFKIHLHPTFYNPQMLDTCKIVCIIRDPKDVALSFYHYSKEFHLIDFEGDLKEFTQLFIDGKVPYGSISNWIKHWSQYWKHENVHHIFYEELQKNTKDELKKLTDFLGCRMDDDQLDKLIHYTSIKEMKNRPSFSESGKKISINDSITKGGFLRKGLVGESKIMFPPSLHEMLEKHLREELKGIDLPYDYLKQ